MGGEVAVTTVRGALQEPSKEENSAALYTIQPPQPSPSEFYFSDED